jgi:hypothetical protein
MTDTREESRLGAGRHLSSVPARPTNSVTTVHELTTHDGAKVSGVLSVVPGATTVVALMHPRQDLTHHPLVPFLLSAGAAVWTQQTRSVNNDIALVHEAALLDAAAGLVFLREHGFTSIVTFGHSGGGPLWAYYVEQAGLPAAERIAATPTGRPTGLPDADMPTPDGTIFLAPHPGQGNLLLACIDPSVADEADPLSVVDELNPYDFANGFAEPPASSTFEDEFVTRYRQAQRDRIARIDVRARELASDAQDARRRFKASGLAADRRAGVAPRIITVFRTDADLRTVDLSLEPNERPYGSVFGRRPDLTNYGLVGFGRLSTPDAWLSTWSGLSSNASFVRSAPGVTTPTLFIEFTGDQAAFDSDTRRMIDALGSADKTVRGVRGTHFGGPIAPGEPSGAELAAKDVSQWLSERFALAGG